VEKESNANYNVRKILFAFLISALFISPTLVFSSPSLELEKDTDSRYSSTSETNLYSLYFSTANESDMDGLITTKIPESGGQESKSALDEDVEFKTNKFLSSIDFFGRKFASEDSYFVTVNLFMKATGPSQSSVDWTISIETPSGEIGKTNWDGTVCESSFQNSCDFDYESFDISIGSNQMFSIQKDEQLEVKVTATMSGCNDGLFSNCEAEIAWNQISGDNRHSSLEVDGNALADTIIKTQRKGAQIAEGSKLEWYPNDVEDEMKMQFSIDVQSAFGRYDIKIIELFVRDPDGIYRVDHRITGADEGIEDSNNGIFGTYIWNYPSDLPSGEYSVELRVTDIQGNQVTIEHEKITMMEWGISVKDRNSGSTVYVAPGQYSYVDLEIKNIGDSSKAITAEVDLRTTLGSSWLVEVDSPEGYEIQSGGSTVYATLSLKAPEDLTGTPSKITIRVSAEGIVNGAEAFVDLDEIVYNLEETDVYTPPVVSIWSDDHKVPIANSSRPGSIDSTIPRFVNHDEFNPFILEIFNSAFGPDSFRIDVLKRSKSLIRIFDNSTNEQITEDPGDGTFHYPPDPNGEESGVQLPRFQTAELRLEIKPSLDREDSDIAEIQLEITSDGNSNLTSLVTFTVQRTFGIRAEVSQDCDGTPLGYMRVSLCSPDSERPELEFRTRITNSMSDQPAVNWLIQDPSSLKKNLDLNQAYGQWNFNIRNSDGEAVPRISLGSGEFTELFVTATLTNQVVSGNHTIYLRVIEDTEDSNPRYFDLPITFDIEPLPPNLQILQVSPNSLLLPGEEYSIQMKVKNLGNSPQTVLLDADVEQAEWKAEIGGLSGSPLVVIDPFDETGFTLIITVPDSARNADTIPISVSASPLDTEQSFPQSYTAKLSLNAVVELSSISDILISEIVNPRPITLVILVLSTFLIIPGIQFWFNRRRWSAQMEYMEALNSTNASSEENEEGLEKIDDSLPPPVTSSQEINDTERYEDDDIELI